MKIRRFAANSRELCEISAGREMGHRASESANGCESSRILAKRNHHSEIEDSHFAFAIPFIENEKS